MKSNKDWTDIQADIMEHTRKAIHGRTKRSRKLRVKTFFSVLRLFEISELNKTITEYKI